MISLLVWLMGRHMRVINKIFIILAINKIFVILALRWEEE